MTESDILELLAKKYAPQAWAFLPQVRNQTGFQRETRTADALAMSLYPSRGLDLLGFEIKVSRSDWIHELKTPEKAEHFFGLCDYWWVVAPEGVVELSEVPTNWGYMSTKGKKLKIEKPAPKNQAKPIDRIQFAAIMRNLLEVHTPEARIKAAQKKGYDKGREEAHGEARHVEESYRDLQKSVQAFAKYSGISLSTWTSDDRFRDIGKAVEVVLSGKDIQIRERLENLSHGLHDLVRDCDTILHGGAK